MPRHRVLLARCLLAGAGMLSGPPVGVLPGGPSLVPRFGGVQGLLGPHVPPQGGLGAPGLGGLPGGGLGAPPGRGRQPRHDFI